VAQFDSLQSIVTFAVQREQEAVDFYGTLANVAAIPSVADELRRIRRAEEGHRDRLLAMDVATAAASMPAAEGVRISDYVVTAEPNPGMIWHDVVKIAIEREQASFSLYAALGRLAGDSAAKELFETLAGEEAGHRAYFQKLYDEHLYTPAERPL
jgi:rubrerythrin